MLVELIEGKLECIESYTLEPVRWSAPFMLHRPHRRLMPDGTVKTVFAYFR
jgi:hypothetical protein